MKSLLAVVFSLLWCVSGAFALDERKLVDMTYPFSDDTPHWPTAKPFQLEKVHAGRTPQGYWYSS
ncbi:MAG: cyclase family protein, partial [Deltaproteobacteria bacterium]|nr:cyclase family protein [Deltaproteobacteria bacterium]